MAHGILTVFLGMAIGSQTFEAEGTVRRVDALSHSQFGAGDLPGFDELHGSGGGI